MTGVKPSTMPTLINTWEHAIAIDAAKAHGLTLREIDESPDECQEQQQHTSRAQETLFLAHGAEDEVGILLGHELQFGLCTIQETLALQAARTDGYLRLVDVVAGTTQVLVETLMRERW